METTVEEISATRRQYEAEREKPVKVSRYLTVQLDALPTYEPIRLKFISSGGWASHYDVEIVGGPDNGKRVTTYPWHPEMYLGDLYGKFNGTREEADEYLSYSARPCIASCIGGLNAVTVAYLSGILVSMREQDMADFLTSMWNWVPEVPR